MANRDPILAVQHTEPDKGRVSIFQFSLRNLLLAVAAVAVGTATLLNANEWWASLLWGLAFLLLVFAGLVALFRREEQRAFWTGYLATTTVYLFLVMFAGGTLAPLITTNVIGWGYSLFPDSKKSPYLPIIVPQAGGGGGTMPGVQGFFPGGTANPSYIDPKEFVQVGHALWMFLLSWLGGTVAIWLYRTRETSNMAAASNRDANR